MIVHLLRPTLSTCRYLGWPPLAESRWRAICSVFLNALSVTVQRHSDDVCELVTLIQLMANEDEMTTDGFGDATYTSQRSAKHSVFLLVELETGFIMVQDVVKREGHEVSELDQVTSIDVGSI